MSTDDDGAHRIREPLPRIFLTFDDGPDAEWTPRFLDALAERDAAATFFVVGQRAHAAAPLLRRIVNEGHAVGNHTFEHRHPWTLSASRARREVRDGAAAIAQITGRPTAFFRPPFGRVRHCMVEEARTLGQSVILWNRSAADWAPFASASRITRRLSGLQRGDIVLMHDGGGKLNRPGMLLQVFPTLLRALADRPLVCAALTPQVCSERTQR